MKRRPVGRSLVLMEQQATFHIVGGTSRSRAEQARLIFSRGIHAEVHADLADLTARRITPGLVLVSADTLERGIAGFIEDLADAGVWLPVVATSEEASVERIVGNVRDGAFDFCALPLRHGDLDRLMARMAREAPEHIAIRRRTADARRRIAALSRREREVLDWLCEGSSNKLIARALNISPRTVEIHRANMMDKLGAQHSAEAVRIQCAAGLESTAQPAGDQPEAEPALPVEAFRIGLAQPSVQSLLRPPAPPAELRAA